MQAKHTHIKKKNLSERPTPQPCFFRNELLESVWEGHSLSLTPCANCPPELRECFSGIFLMAFPPCGW